MTRARTVVAGVAGGFAFAVTSVATFGLLGGSRPGRTGLLFDPASQHPKVIAVWKEIEPLPRIVDAPVLMLAGLVALGVAYAFLYRSIAPAWPAGLHRRAVRLALIVWLAAVFAEFMGPFNVLHQPLPLSALAVALWAVCALAEGYVLVLATGRASAAV